MTGIGWFRAEMLIRAGVLSSMVGLAVHLAATASGQSPDCEGGGRSLARSSRVSVVQTPSGATFACTAHQKVLLSTGDLELIFSASALAIRGTRVAYGYGVYEDPNDLGGTEVRIVDLSEPAPADTVRRLPAGPENLVKVVSIRLAAHGGVAWTACRSSTIPPQRTNGRGTRCHRRGTPAWLYAAEAPASEVASQTARPRLLDQGRSLTPSSLKLSGRTVVWRSSGQRRTAKLP